MTSTNSATETAPIAHVEFRPMFDFGDHCVICSIYDAEYYGVYSAASGEPVSRDEVFDDAVDALDDIFGSGKYAGVRKWYNGNEMLSEITTKDDIFAILSDVYCCDDEEYAELGDKLGFDADKSKALKERATASQSGSFAPRA